MALGISALTLVETIEDELGIDALAETTRLERYINVASDAIAMYLGRGLHFITGVTESISVPDGRTQLLLERYPVTALLSIEWGATLFADDVDYRHDLDNGIITYIKGVWPSSSPVLVTYSGGWVTPAQAILEGTTRTLPYDIEHACVMTVVSLRRSKGRDPMVASESMGPASVAYGGLNTAIGRGVGGVIPDTAIAILDKYRTVRMS